MVNAFSFCLYGPHHPQYYVGMRENIVMIQAFFPEWVTYVYIGPDVTDDMRKFLAYYPTVRIRETGETGAINMIHRFYAIDEPDVDLMMVRDADSRIHWKDRWAIRQFVASSFQAHTHRDHRDHTALMMGGLWGIRKTAGINIRAEYAIFKENPAEHKLGHDQNFLIERIYPKVFDNLLIHYSNGRAISVETNAIEFPFAWSDDVYCGKRELDYIERPQPVEKRQLWPNVVMRIRDAPSPSTTAPPPPPVSEPPVVVPHLRGPPPNLLTFLNRK